MRQRAKARIAIGLALAAGILLFILANAHLVAVAITSQPDCVPHLKEAGRVAGAYRAAQSAC
jgi:hypothetical protein